MHAQLLEGRPGSSNGMQLPAVRPPAAGSRGRPRTANDSGLRPSSHAVDASFELFEHDSVFDLGPQISFASAELHSSGMHGTSIRGASMQPDASGANSVQFAELERRAVADYLADFGDETKGLLHQAQRRRQVATAVQVRPQTRYRRSR